MNLSADLARMLDLLEEQRQASAQKWANVGGSIGNIAAGIGQSIQEGRATDAAQQAYENLLSKANQPTGELTSRSWTGAGPGEWQTPTTPPVSPGDIEQLAFTKNLPEGMQKAFLHIGEQEREAGSSREQMESSDALRRAIAELEKGTRVETTGMTVTGAGERTAKQIEAANARAAKELARKEEEAKRMSGESQKDRDARLAAAGISAGGKAAEKQVREEKTAKKGVANARRQAIQDAANMPPLRSASDKPDMRQIQASLMTLTTPEEQDAYLAQLVLLGKLRKSHHLEIARSLE